MLAQFHFLQPIWLFALIPLAILWWFSARAKSGNAKAWAKVIDAKLLPLLLGGVDAEQQKSGTLGKWLLAIAWLITTIALADPVWEKIPRPIFQTNTARVIVLDLSSSMMIADLKPSRLARARFKVEDILSEEFVKNEEGQIGLVLFAGDAFTVSPLTRDTETIRALLQVLTPTLMPSQGSRVDLGLQKAQELLAQAGVENGEVLLIADGVTDQTATLKMVRRLKNNGHRLSVLGIGTELGGVLPNIKYRDGKSITVALDAELLKEIAKTGGGNYHLISANNSDLKSVLAKAFSPNKPLEQSEDQESEDWKSTGPWLIILLLPFAALAFRRGWLFTVFIAVSLVGISQPQVALAEEPLIKTAETKTTPLNSFWNNLWSNKEQQADQALQNQQYDKANLLSENPLMQGTAKYKKKEYKEALEKFKQASGADARYNEGNALAKIEKYKEAIEAYDKALKQQPKMDDAIKNKTAIEKLLKQQKKKKPDEKKSDKNKKDGEQKDQDKNKGDKQQEKKEGEKGKESDDKKQDKSGKKNDEDSKDNKNQFSDANKELDKNKDSEKQNEKDAADKKAKESEENKELKEEDKNKTNSKDDKSKEATEEKNKEKGTKAEAKELSEEEKMAAEQWLRRIPDDPGGLLRRKFQRQYKQRRRPTNNAEEPW